MFRHFVTLWAAVILCCLAETTRALRRRPSLLRGAPLVLKEPNKHRELFPKEWWVNFDTAAAEFKGGPNPNVVLIYEGPKPYKKVTYYRLQIMDPTCSFFVTSNGRAINPTDIDGIIPDTSYNEVTGKLEAKLDIDTAKIKSSIFHTDGAIPERFTITFCARMDLYGNLYDDEPKVAATEKTIVTFAVDTTQEFEMNDLRFTSEVISTADETILVDFPLKTIFCDDDYVEVLATDIMPGQPFQICISSESTDAYVKSLRSVSIKNSEDDTLNIPLVGVDSLPTSVQTRLLCPGRVCSLKTIAYARAFEKPYEDGKVEDISKTSKLVGTVILELATSRRRTQSGDAGTATTGFDLGVNLAKPPPPSISSASSWLASSWFAMSTAVIFGCLYML